MDETKMTPKNCFMDDTISYDPDLIKDIDLSDETTRKLEMIFSEEQERPQVA